MKTTVYLIRHAEAAGNVNNTYQGRTDLPVTERGEAQLEHLAERFRSVALDALYSSPLVRAQQTARAANRHHGLPLRLEPDLIELDGGDIEGVQWSLLPVLYPVESELWNNEPHRYRAPGGESMAELCTRMQRAMAHIVGENEGKTICVVSHGCAIRAYLRAAYGWAPERLRDVMWEENTAVSRLEFDDAGLPQVLYHNDVTHLAAELCTVAQQDWWKSSITEGATI